VQRVLLRRTQEARSLGLELGEQGVVVAQQGPQGVAGVLLRPPRRGEARLPLLPGELEGRLPGGEGLGPPLRRGMAPLGLEHLLPV
jgi:hypothetical protein